MMIILFIIEALQDSFCMLIGYISDNSIRSLLGNGHEETFVEAETSFALICSLKHVDDSFIISVVVLKNLKS
jgi:hypothetical protein